MLTSSLKITKLAALSRPIIGVARKSLIITLPGSMKGSIENLEAIADLLPHVLELIGAEPNAGETFHQDLQRERARETQQPPSHHVHTCTHHSDTQTGERTGLLSNDPALSGTSTIGLT